MRLSTSSADRRGWIEIADHGYPKFVAKLGIDVVFKRCGREFHSASVDPIDNGSAVGDKEIPFGHFRRCRATAIRNPKPDVIDSVTIHVARDRAFTYADKWCAGVELEGCLASRAK